PTPQPAVPNTRSPAIMRKTTYGTRTEATTPRPGCRGGCSGRRRAAVGGRAPEGLSQTVVKPRPNCVFLSSWPTVRLVGGTRPAWETRTGEGTMMFARIVTFTGATDIDAGIRYLSNTVAPLLAEQKGFRGVTASADRSGGVMGVLSLWETEADRDASGSTLVNAREEEGGSSAAR